MSSRRNKFVLFLGVVAAAALLGGCRKEDMSDQPKFYKPFKQTVVFADGTTARPIPAGTIARGHLEIEVDHYQGVVPGPDGLPKLGADGHPIPINYIPIPITHADLERGQQKYMIYCAVCHGAIGDGKGMVVQRGMVEPPSLVRLDRPMSAREYNVQHAPIGHYFDVISNGYGAMYSYNDRVAVDDRWRICAYIKALQLSQDADLKVATIQTPPAGDAPVPVQAPVAPGAVVPNSVGPTTQP